eukprot:COSAG01_NODE_875_length_12972_cov_61.925503_16_plen_69_part_00
MVTDGPSVSQEKRIKAEADLANTQESLRAVQISLGVAEDELRKKVNEVEATKEEMKSIPRLDQGRISC